jgi:hypothetical protein
MKQTIAYITVRALDIITTLMFFNRGGRELNPLYRLTLQANIESFLITNIVLSAFIGLCFIILWNERLMRIIFKLFLLMNLAVVVMNAILM